MRTASPALGDIFPDVQTNDVAEQVSDNDRDSRQDIQGESM